MNAKLNSKRKNSTLELKSREKEMKIRPFDFESDKDYEALVAIANALEPDIPSSVTGWKHYDRSRDAKYLHQRLLGEYEGEVVAVGMYGHTTWSFKPDKYFVRVMVHPKAQRQGFGNTLYDFILEQLEPREPRLLIGFTREHFTDAIRFLENRGYKKVMRVPVSRLESATFDAERFAEKLERVANSGIAIKTMAQLREEDPEWKRKLYELEWELVQDVPTPDTLTKRPFEQFEKQTLGSPNLLPDAWFVALDGDKYVGLSVLWRNLSNSKLLETGLTGVARSHRRRGIATALKVHAIRYAQEYGNAAIVTDNEENNPMFQLNLQLGFKPLPAALDYMKEVNDGDEAEAEEPDSERVVSPV